MPTAEGCAMFERVYGPQPGATFHTEWGGWYLPCPAPVVGTGHDGHPYCRWHLDMVDQPAMDFDLVDGRLRGPYVLKDNEDND
jgi:hypothetical protein